MRNENKARLAHELLDEVNAREDLTPEQVGVLRSFLPERPKQKALEEIAHDVYDAWGAAYGNDWADDVFGELEDWLDELHKQLKGLAPAKPVHPEFLETEADYDDAPFGTIVVGKNYYPWTKIQGSWLAYGAQPRNDFEMRVCRRYVLRWGDK